MAEGCRYSYRKEEAELGNCILASLTIPSFATGVQMHMDDAFQDAEQPLRSPLEQHGSAPTRSIRHGCIILSDAGRNPARACLSTVRQPFDQLRESTTTVRMQVCSCRTAAILCRAIRTEVGNKVEEFGETERTTIM